MDKFDVKYKASGKNLNFYGKGTLYMHDTCLVFEGDMPKFRIPVLWWVYHKVLNVRTTRTVPYSAILRYDPRSFSSLLRGNFQQITYRLPDYRPQKVAFRILGPKPGKKDSFRTRLEEYMTVAKSLIVD